MNAPSDSDMKAMRNEFEAEVRALVDRRDPGVPASSALAEAAEELARRYTEERGLDVESKGYRKISFVTKDDPKLPDGEHHTHGVIVVFKHPDGFVSISAITDDGAAVVTEAATGKVRKFPAMEPASIEFQDGNRIEFPEGGSPLRSTKKGPRFLG